MGGWGQSGLAGLARCAAHGQGGSRPLFAVFSNFILRLFSPQPGPQSLPCLHPISEAGLTFFL